MAVAVARFKEMRRHLWVRRVDKTEADPLANDATQQFVQASRQNRAVREFADPADVGSDHLSRGASLEAIGDHSVDEALDGLLVADVFAARRLFCKHLLRDLSEPVKEACLEVLDEGEEDGFLRGEVQIDRPGCDPGGSRYRLHRRRAETPLPEQPSRRLEDVPPSLVGGLDDAGPSRLVQSPWGRGRI
jgi:hypothetical protein